MEYLCTPVSKIVINKILLAIFGYLKNSFYLCTPFRTKRDFLINSLLQFT